MWCRNSGRGLVVILGLQFTLVMGCTPPAEPPKGAGSGTKPGVSNTSGKEKEAAAPAAGTKHLAVAPVRTENNMADEAAKHAALQEYRRLPPPDAKMFPGLKQVSEDCDVWFDQEKKRVVLQGGVCLREGQLEMLSCIHRWIDDKFAPQGKIRRGTKEYESVLTVNTSAAVVHSALLLTGAKPGSPVKFQPKYEPARGTEIEITLFWTDADGKPQEAKGQDWVQNVKTKEAMSQNWVFAGSGFREGEEKGQQQYLGENGNLICVANFADAVLDIPVPSTSTNEALMFEAFTARIPPLGTTVTIVLTPKVGK